MQTNSTCTKTSLAIDNGNWQKLQNRKNRSHTVNVALKFFFDYEELIKNHENKYWDNVRKSLLNNNWDYISLNPNWEKINEDILEEKLWK